MSAQQSNESTDEILNDIYFLLYHYFQMLNHDFQMLNQTPYDETRFLIFMQENLQASDDDMRSATKNVIFLDSQYYIQRNMHNLDLYNKNYD